jgi:hypothetical protein
MKKIGNYNHTDRNEKNWRANVYVYVSVYGYELRFKNNKTVIKEMCI